MLLRYRGQHKLRSRAGVAKNPDRKDRKGKDRKGEAATETSELGPTKSLDLLRASAESWYVGVYVNIWRRYSGGLTLLANYTWSKDLSNAPDFRSPMFESSVPQNNNNDLAAEKGPACDVASICPRCGLRYSCLGSLRWCVLSAKTGICPPSTRCRPVFLLRFQCSAILLLRGLSSERIPFAPMCGAATVSLGNSHLRKLVQYRGICRASRLYVRGCGMQFNLSAGHANAGSGVGPRL
jgi:hypothetical protein